MSGVLRMLDTMRTEKEILEALINGTVRIRRFNAQEQGSSSRDADRLLWLGILRAESELATLERGKVCPGTPAPLGGTPPPCRFLKSIAQPLPPSFGELAELLGHYEDRGQESIVCNSGDGFVNKLRPMRPSILSGYFAPLASIIYHNRIFPKDRYTLENIYFQGSRYFMVLRQERVEILLNDDGYPEKPTAGMIRAAISALNIGLVEYCGDDFPDASSSDSDIDETDGSRMRFYNADYYISDLQPGRNTVIDANNGNVRFIDPRITLNDPAGPITPVAKIGKRKEELPGQLIT